MAWQDLVFAGGNIVLGIALWFSVISPYKPAIRTSLITGITITVFALTFATMGLWLSALGAAGNAVLWAVLVVQVLRARARIHEIH